MSANWTPGIPLNVGDTVQTSQGPMVVVATGTSGPSGVSSSPLPARCPDCGGRFTDGHDDGRDRVDVWCVNCDTAWTCDWPTGWRREPKEGET